MSVAGGQIHGFDLFVLAYLLWGWLRGRRRGVGCELHGLVRLALVGALLVGFSVFSWLRAWLDGVVGSIPHFKGILGAATALLATLWILHLMRNRFGRFVEARLSPARVRSAGGWVGAMRTGLASFLLAGLLGAVPIAAISAPVATSFSGRGALWIGAWAASLSPLAPTSAAEAQRL
jgi:hypothetical protein